MQAVRAWAQGLVCATTLVGKRCAPPTGMTVDDDDPLPLRIETPGRPANLQIAAGRKVTVPPVAGMRDPAQRARILHALANHELQAVELFAWALLMFPGAPRAFRTGLVGIIVEEQRHMNLYIERLTAHGVDFGDQPVTGHFWNKLEQLATPLGFVCAMGLTFENANLDFAGDYQRAAIEAGDHQTAAVLGVVHDDEIGHVRFAWTWLRKFAPDQDPWKTYLASVEFPLGPHRARGRDFDADARRRAGLSPEFIAELAASTPTRPGGGPR